MKRNRLVPLLAAVLFLVSLAFPFWTARMRAPTYPEQDLFLQIYATKYAGDIEEWDRVGRLVGMRVPPPIPEEFFELFPLAIVGMSLLAAAAAAVPRLLTAAAIAPWLLMAVVSAWGQYSLYLFGHNLDPDRPLRFLEPFTPPIVGIVTMGKIQLFHYPDISSLLFIAGGIFLTVSAWRAGRLPRVARRRQLSGATVTP